RAYSWRAVRPSVAHHKLRSYLNKDSFLERTTFDPLTGCWVWTGTLSADGYGRVYTGARNTAWAHRVSYELHRAPIPAGCQIDHLCRNRACVNPAHLEVVSARENTLRGATVTARNARKTHCIHGHPFDAANTIYRHGRRECRACRVRNDRARYERRRQS